MKTVFPKDIADSMRTCILSIFWPKRDIIDFFNNNGCTKSDLKDVNLSLNRAQIIDTVFRNLNKRTDGGIGQLRSMLQNLVVWNHFDPYYFKELGKLNENDAIRN